MSNGPSVGEQIDRVCDRFEAAWKDHGHPRIADYLPSGPAETDILETRNQLLVELILIDLEYRLARGEQASVEAYLNEFPEVLDAGGKPPERLLQEEASLLRSPRLRREANRTLHLQPAGSNVDSGRLPASNLRPAGGGNRTDDGNPYDDDVGETEIPRRLIDEYELIGEIGRGGMGIVYRARDRKLKCDVALKMIRAGEFAGREQIERFYGEAEAAAKLQHPGIVGIHRIGEVGGLPYFTMDFIEGESLDKLVKREGFLESDAVEFVIQICEAVEYAHQHGVLHRDIKPSNVLVGEASRALVTDFGLAKQVEQQSDFSRTGQPLGTPGYMPPEQAEGRKDAVGYQSDVYSIGALLYHLLTGRPPFEGQTHAEIIAKVIHNEAVPASKLNRSVSRDLNTICMKCLEKERSCRYVSAAELRDDLRRFSQGFPILARPVSTAERFYRWCRRNKMVATLALATCLTAAIGGVVGGYEYYRSEQHRARAGAELNARMLAATLQLDNEIRSAELTAEVSHDALIPERVGLDADKLSAALDTYEKARSDWQSFHGETISDDRRQGESAEALFRIAEASRLLGDEERSEDAFKSAIETFGELTAENASNPTLLVMKGKSLDYLGELYRDQDRLESAEKIYRESLDVLSRSLQQFPHCSDASVELARTNNNYGILLQDRGQLAEAMDRFSASANALRQFCDQPASTDQQRQDLARTLINMARLQTKLGELADAEALYQDALQEFDTLLKDAPDNQRYRFLLATTKKNLGYLLAFHSGNLEAGESYLKEAYEQFAKLPKHIQEYRFNLAKSLLNLCFLCGTRFQQTEDASHLQAARAYCRQAVDELAILHDASPEVAEFDSWMAIAKGNLGAISDAEGDYESFAKHLTEAITLQRQAHNKRPENEEYRTRLRDHHVFFFSQVLRDHLGEDRGTRTREALEHFLSATELGYRTNFQDNVLLDPFRDLPRFQETIEKLVDSSP